MKMVTVGWPIGNALPRAARGDGMPLPTKSVSMPFAGLSLDGDGIIDISRTVSRCALEW